MQIKALPALLALLFVTTQISHVSDTLPGPLEHSSGARSRLPRRPRTPTPTSTNDMVHPPGRRSARFSRAPSQRISFRLRWTS